MRYAYARSLDTIRMRNKLIGVNKKKSNLYVKI